MTYVQDDSATAFWCDNSTVERAQRRCFAWPRSTSEPSPLTTRLVTRPSISASCMTTPTSRALLKSHSRNYAPVRSSSSKRRTQRPGRTPHAIRTLPRSNRVRPAPLPPPVGASITRIRKPIRAGRRSIRAVVSPRQRDLSTPEAWSARHEVREAVSELLADQRDGRGASRRSE